MLFDGASDAAKRFQQTSGMVMAKGVEDCAFYRWSRLTSLNEVGGDPSVFAVAPDAFHDAMTTRQADWPHAMTAGSTHDTKRGEDVRARIAVLAELPDRWAAALDRLLELVPLPDPGFGKPAVAGDRRRLAGRRRRRPRPALPLPRLRREGDARGRRPHHVDRARTRPTRRPCTPPSTRSSTTPRCAQVVEDLVAEIAGPGWSNALAAKLVSLTIPGVPDVYQGSELWEQSLVDPDNRRPVDFAHRARALERLRSGERPALAGGPDDDGTVKLLAHPHRARRAPRPARPLHDVRRR